MYYYKAFGMTICSDVEVIPFSPIATAEYCDVYFKRGSVAIPEEVDRSRLRVMMNVPSGMFMYWREIGVFLIEDGTRVTYQPTTEPARTGLINSVFLGPVLGLLMFQRQSHFVYHSSVVGKSDGKGAVAFVASKGGGKSTMATLMIQNGYSLVSDDLLAVDRHRDGSWVEPGFPGMKLWPDAAEQISNDVSSLPSIGGKDVDYDKRIVSLENQYIDSPLPLNSVIFLDYGEEDNPRIEPLNKKEALFYLMPHWYGSMFNGLLLPMLGKQRLFDECAALARTGRIYRLIRPRSLEKLSLSLELVNELRDQPVLE